MTFSLERVVRPRMESWGLWFQKGALTIAICRAVKELLQFGDVVEEEGGVYFTAPRPAEDTIYTIQWDDLLSKLNLPPNTMLRYSNPFIYPLHCQVETDPISIKIKVAGTKSGETSAGTELPQVVVLEDQGEIDDTG